MNAVGIWVLRSRVCGGVGTVFVGDGALGVSGLSFCSESQGTALCRVPAPLRAFARKSVCDIRENHN